MDLMTAQVSSWLLGGVLALVMFACWWAGWILGSRHPANPDEKSSSRFVEGSLALMGLLLGFAFAMALSKHDQRRQMIISDANSIADMYTVASFLPEPQKKGLQEALRSYIEIRLVMGNANADPTIVSKGMADSEKLQGRMTEIAQDAVRAGTPLTLPLVDRLNNLTSNHISMFAAMRDRLPLQVLILLTAAAVISTVLVARHHGARQKLHVSGTVCYILLVSLVVVVILDLNQPMQGFTRVSMAPLEHVSKIMGK